MSRSKQFPRAVFSMLLGISAMAVLPASAQLPNPGYKVRVDVNTVFLNVSVRDRNNHNIAHLNKDDFLVYEDGVPQEIRQLVSEESPFNILLLIDNSGSTKPYLQLIQNAAVLFIGRMKPDDQIAVAAFNSLVELVRDFTDDRPALQRAIGKIESIGGTALYDSLLTCVNRYMHGAGARGAIVVFTDGFDNQLEGHNSEGSRTPFEVLYRRIQEIQPVIYTIFLNGREIPRVPRQESRQRPMVFGWPWPRKSSASAPADHPDQSSISETAKQHLYMIADQTGGRMFSLTSAGDLASAYTQIADDLGACYQLAYNSTNTARDKRWREIRVRMKTHPEAAVRTRKGYYATEP
jgi:Ca-activated chloride channel homolog